LPIVNKSFKSDPTKVVIGTVDLFYDWIVLLLNEKF
jgi:hypothetical protein